MIKTTFEPGENEWMEYVSNCEDAWIYHTPGWKKFLETTFNYKPFYLFNKNESGNLTGLLPLIHIKSSLTGSRLCCLPFSHTCKIIGELDARKELLRKALELKDKLKIPYIEIKDSVKVDSFHEHSVFSTYVLELSQDLDEMWNMVRKASKGGITRAVKKSRAAGVAVRRSNSMDDLMEFYRLNCLSKKSLGVPCHPWSFFKNLFACLKDNATLYTVIYKDEKIAGGIILSFKNTVIYGYGAANSDYLHLRPYNALLWKTIEDACENGYRFYDFGRAMRNDEGLTTFKKRWGTNELKLIYSYYPGNPNSIKENRTGIKYNICSNIFRRMPLCLYEKVSSHIFKHFG